MAQLNFYVPDKIEEIIRREAKSKGESVSSYLGNIIKSNIPHDEWSKDFFTKVVGGWQGDFPVIEEPILKEIDSL